MSNFICPICHKKLQQDNKSYKCKNNHSYDLAKEGYVNLLPVNAKKSKQPGDNNKMIFARRSFLEAGYYSPLAERLSQIINKLLPDSHTVNILDLGCGEGYYSGYISKSIQASFNFTALDISKVAVKYGAKRHKEVNFCVASAYKMPVKSNSVDLLYRIYAPSSLSELDRVIKKGGVFITVTPGDNHLYSLREMIYDEVLNLSTKTDESEHFKLIRDEDLSYMLNISKKEDLLNLLDMTPFGWKIKPEVKTTLLSQKLWNIECDFKISIYQKTI